MLNALDYGVILAWLIFSFGVGLWYAKRASAGTDAFFVTDRSLPWWAIGTSMVATTFAADTPLAVAGYVAAGGISANWAWWFTGVGAMATVFLFAKLWRRAGVVTDAELTELRYGGAASQVLRGVKSLWFGAFINVLVIAWVMRAMQKISVVVLDLQPDATFLGMPAGTAVVLGLFTLTVVYTGTSGLFGVIATDVVQFLLAMTGAILMAVLSWRAAGGLSGMQAGFASHDFDWNATTALWPTFDGTSDGKGAELLVLLGVLWWASRNVDGGGYLAQRLFSAKNEAHALWGYLWFTVANLCLRPWPWILVGLAGMSLLGPLEDPETYYPRMMVLVLPAGLFGLLVASFLAAFMSTIDTQLHWGASLLVNDLYRRFIRPEASDAHHLLASRFAVVGLAVFGALVSFVLTDIRFAWELAISVTAGLGAVYVARWFWWRTNAWSEITAMVFASALTLLLNILRAHHPETEGVTLPWDSLATIPRAWLGFPFDAVFAVSLGLPLWIAVTLFTPAPDRAHLRVFYQRARPGGPGWRSIASDLPSFSTDGPDRYTLLGLLCGTVALYAFLLGTGELLLGRPQSAVPYVVLVLIGAPITAWVARREAARI